MSCCLHTGFTSWFGGQGIGSDCATWCRAVFIRGLHLGLEDRILVLLCHLVLCCLHTGFTSWLRGQGIGSDCAPWCRAVFIRGLHQILCLEDSVLVLLCHLVLCCLHTGFTSWFGGQGIGSDCATWCRTVFIRGLHNGLEDRVFIASDCATWCRAVFIRGLHLGLEDRVLVLIVPLGAVLSSYGFSSWFGRQGIGSDCATWCRAVFIRGLHLGLEDRV